VENTTVTESSLMTDVFTRAESNRLPEHDENSGALPQGLPRWADPLRDRGWLRPCNSRHCFSVTVNAPCVYLPAVDQFSTMADPPATMEKAFAEILAGRLNVRQQGNSCHDGFPGIDV